MELTKREAIKEHRKMWLWIARESIKQKRCMTKEEYLSEYNYPEISSRCFCCEYVRENFEHCNMCPVDWITVTSCMGNGSYYIGWRNATIKSNYVESAFLAYKISQLPERKETTNEN